VQANPQPTFPALPPLPSLPQRLSAEPPGWVREVDIVVIGSGIAGLTAALECRDLGTIMVVTKDEVSAGSTHWAQGGIAWVQAEGDSVEQHIDDTLVAGAGLCIEEAVRVLVTEGPDEVAKLINRGAEFDRDLAGKLELTREGGHMRHRIAHAGGDATGAEVQRTLDTALRGAGVEVRESCIALDAVMDLDGRVAGLVVADVDSLGAISDVTLIRTSAVVLATGGFGQAFAVTTNPPESTGDGLALAWRCGAELGDVEFVQFHPTAFWQPDGQGQQLLVSEAVRGEGATLVDATGVPVMRDVHPLGDLAPRDVVATAIAMRMRLAPGGVDDHVFLDATSLGPSIVERFPTIVARCRAAGIDPVTEPIPVAPAAHFACGGIRATLDGTTSIPGLWAIGEVADTGIHGANRLASNGVTEGLVAGRLVAERLAGPLPESGAPVLAAEQLDAVSVEARDAMTGSMSRWAGPLREADGLRKADAVLADVPTLDKLRTLSDV
ncbi:MAG: L-aspartate oxidase, partial [Actinomycetes bacterium]